MWTNFTRAYRSPLGDQGWPEIQYPNADIWQEVFPEKIISYKVHIKNRGRQPSPRFTKHGGNLDTASIVCFHGRPSPHEVKEEWMMEKWHQI